MQATKSAPKYEIAESSDRPGEWRAEGIDYDGDGQCFVVIFSGPEARSRAEEYAAWKNQSAAI